MKIILAFLLITVMLWSDTCSDAKDSIARYRSMISMTSSPGVKSEYIVKMVAQMKEQRDSCFMPGRDKLKLEKEMADYMHMADSLHREAVRVQQINVNHRRVR
jgi:hypothetical protein